MKVFERDVDLDMTPIQGYVLQMLIFFKAYVSITYVTFYIFFKQKYSLKSSFKNKEYRIGCLGDQYLVLCNSKREITEKNVKNKN